MLACLYMKWLPESGNRVTMWRGKTNQFGLGDVKLITSGWGAVSNYGNTNKTHGKRLSFVHITHGTNHHI